MTQLHPANLVVKSDVRPKKRRAKQPHPAAAKRFNLDGRVAWICGGAGYLGATVSRALAEHGATVIVADMQNDRAEAVAESLRQDDLTAEGCVLDIGNEEGVHSQAEEIIGRHGRIDIMVNLTYFSTGRSLMEMTAAEFDAGLRVTLTGAFVVSREAARVMIPQGGGSIIHFSSMYGQVSPDPTMYPETQGVNPPDYGAAKAGVLQLMRYEAVQLAKHRVRVNAIVPGSFPDQRRLGGDTQFMTNLKSRVPMGRVGDHHEIDGAAVFLASDASSYMTGATLVIDGGWTAQ